LTQPAHVFVEAPRHSNERQRIGATAVAQTRRGLSLLRPIHGATAVSRHRSSVLSIVSAAAHAQTKRRSDAIPVDDKCLAIPRYQRERLARTRTLWAEFTRLRVFVVAPGGTR
jgi:hypothetical protein